MEMTRTIRRTWRAATLLAIVMAICTGYLVQGTTSAAADGAAPRFSAVELSDAVLFNEGPAASLLAPLQRGTVPWTPTLRLGQTAVNTVIASSPGWGTSFATALQSGNPVAVRQALTNLSVLSRNALVSTYGSGPVIQAIYRFVGIASGGPSADIARGIIPFNLQRVCCLEDYVDPLVSSILSAFLQDIWSSTAGGQQPPVARAIAELMVARVATGMWAA
ncbi:hypothetical protein [Plantactinospora sp. KBS50]|uniref:hypothetical protein n=1 Tax=Plantactinospora sp. KBS50 TaxID=2024580 RepID=UPI000BAA9F5D|nr:hypothetical protein [Plantactinospora sp. KBS50]ASW52925.1 hypothetical protein CIK06_00090 [Plantactinospora sp. KBS50]